MFILKVKEALFLQNTVQTIWWCFVFIQSFMNISFTILGLKIWLDFHTKKYKGASFRKKVSGVTVLDLGILSDDHSNLYQLSWTIFDSLKLRCDYNFRSSYLHKNEDGIMLLKCRKSYGGCGC